MSPHEVWKRTEALLNLGILKILKFIVSGIFGSIMASPLAARRFAGAA